VIAGPDRLRDFVTPSSVGGVVRLVRARDRTAREELHAEARRARRPRVRRPRWLHPLPQLDGTSEDDGIVALDRASRTGAAVTWRTRDSSSAPMASAILSVAPSLNAALPGLSWLDTGPTSAARRRNRARLSAPRSFPIARSGAYCISVRASFRATLGLYVTWPSRMQVASFVAGGAYVHSPPYSGPDHSSCRGRSINRSSACRLSMQAQPRSSVGCRGGSIMGASAGDSAAISPAWRRGAFRLFFDPGTRTNARKARLALAYSHQHPNLVCGPLRFFL
jgi:hypothetical protein